MVLPPKSSTINGQSGISSEKPSVFTKDRKATGKYSFLIIEELYFKNTSIDMESICLVVSDLWQSYKASI